MSYQSAEKQEAIPRLFGTSGIRGKIGSDITTPLALDVGKALGTYLGGKGKVVVGYDTRTSNHMLEKALCAGLMECGCNVLELGMVPTPVVGFSASRLNADAGVMITASHNPSPDNGIKLWNRDGMAYTSKQEREIEYLLHQQKFLNMSWDHLGSIEKEDEIINQYIKEVQGMVNILPGLKVVVDCGSGAASYLSPIILRKVGCEVISLNCQPDGFFPGRKVEPNEENLDVLMKTVKMTKSDLGIAHDGDGDRMVAVDEKGNMANFDKLLALISQAIGGKIITTVDASLCMDECLATVGGEIIRTRVGDVHVAQSIMENHASFGGEPSGTWIHPDFCMCPDGILSALKVVELVSTKGRLSELLQSIPDYPSIREKIPCSGEDKNKVMEMVNSSLENQFKNVVDVNNIDGVRISFEDGSWVLVRPSGTEAYIRITLEAKTKKMAEDIKQISTEFIKAALE
ncbi:MAG: phosphoglucosamine mutase [Euryarchaeota archaeon]|nr:phosphoglucosamine mutase [Euryarchaeota archaeon]MBV1729067.1 phosphoglucosamine mutase [Methanobacterium sp.]MBU4548312.1 phosphoglucosamine mutase [Euryarchaeota archaeon]MBU4607005.1 phosphoglucosamine mutase [Euryarchaeota archaeon]MBV1754816.1 phosphoglucosamine mutase [Methanobacterium sp.]